MTIKPDVQQTAEHFAGSSPTFPRLIQAVELAEGNILRAVQCSTDTATRAKALDVTCRSAVHALADFVLSDPELAARFIETWAKVWAPRGVANDPTDLNKNWGPNVRRLFFASARFSSNSPTKS